MRRRHPLTMPCAATPDMLILFGGSFDPIHTGHLATAEGIRRALHATTLTLLPAARSPLKPTVTPDRHRLAMLRLAIQDHPALCIDERELQRPAPSYTVDTLRDLRLEHGPHKPMIWVMGSDSLAQLAQWKEWQALTTLAHCLIVDRPDSPWPARNAATEWLSTLPRATEANQLQCSANGLWLHLTLPPQPFSSTAIRAQLAQRNPDTPQPEGLSKPVWHYILDHALYLPERNHSTP